MVIHGYKKKDPKKQKHGKMALLKLNEKEKDSRASRRRRCLSGSSERPDIYQRSPLRKYDKNK